MDRLVGFGLPGASRTSGTPLLETALQPTLTTTPCTNSSICGAEFPDHGTDDCRQLCHRGDTETALDGLWSSGTHCVGQRDKWRCMHFSLGIDCPNVCGMTADVCRRGCTTRRSITSRGQLGGAGVWPMFRGFQCASRWPSSYPPCTWGCTQWDASGQRTDHPPGTS